MIQFLLEAQHYLVDRSADGKIGYEMAELFEYDLILLDWMVPKLSGIQICKQLRAAGDHTPIILMTGRNTSADEIAGLNAGADDYLIKPFGIDKLLAHVRALLRRSLGMVVSSVLCWRDLRLDLTRAEVSHRNKTLSLTPKEYLLLALLLQNPHRIFSINILLERLWPLEELHNPAAVRTHVKGLRRKLKAAGLTDAIETVYGLGYRLTADEKQIEH